MQPDPETATPAPHQRRRPVVGALVAVLLGLLLLVAPRSGAAPSGPLPSVPLPSVDPRATLLAVGDVGYCGDTNDEAVANLATSIPGTIALLGDMAYENGSASDYANCFNPAWAPLLPRIRAAPGNHEYQTTDGAAYFEEFGAAAGALGKGWYSYNVGAWHIIVLNSNCSFVGDCRAGSPQLTWLKADLAADHARCTLAYWHHPRFSSGRHGDDDMIAPLWSALAGAGADLVLQAHDHDYERFAPIDGIRSFVVGTGGRSLYEMLRLPAAASEVRDNSSYGLLVLTLRPTDYSWQFVPAAGSTLTDAGTGQCR